MEAKKDIGKLIKDRLAQNEVEPNDALWSSIEATLNEKQRKRGGFLWLYLVLIVLLGTSYIIYKTVQEDPETNDTLNIEVPAVTDDFNSEKNYQNNETPTRKGPTQNEAVQYDTINSKNKIKKDSKEISEYPNAQVGGRNDLNKKHRDTKEGKSKKKTSLVVDVNSGANNAVNFKNSEESNTKEKTAYLNQDEITQTLNKTNSQKEEKRPTASEFFNETVKQKEDSIQKVKDSLKLIKPKITKRKKRTINDTTKIKKKEPSMPDKYWVFPFSSASLYTNLNKSSAINPRLDNNKKLSVLRAGYGAYFVFKATDKWSLRIGASHTAIQKNTFDVRIAPNDPSINYYDNIEFSADTSFNTFSDSFEQSEMITLKEQLAYFTIPIDATYNLWNKSNWGIDAIGGFNAAILGKNKLIAVRENGSSTLLGSNKNYQKSHFGVHLGAGLYYDFNEMIQVRFESQFEPRFDLLKNNGSNNPIIIGTKLGVMLKF